MTSSKLRVEFAAFAIAAAWFLVSAIFSSATTSAVTAADVASVMAAK